MPFNGAGVYSAPGADFPVVTQTVISSTHFNNTINDIATGLSLCLTKDGQQTATANIPFGGFRATNVGITAIAGSVGTPAINVSDAGTGLYRSAASELAVTVAGSQVARFASTGLIVTGAASVSTTLTATTSVVTPLVSSSAGNFTITSPGGNIVLSSGIVVSSGDNITGLGTAALRFANLFTPIIDSGTAGSLLLRTNNGRTGLEVTDPGVTTANWYQFFGQASGTNVVVLRATGSDANISNLQDTKGTGSHQFRTGGGTDIQVQITATGGATRSLVFTGSNGGNPTIGVTAGNLAITPSVVIAGTGLTVGTNPALTSSGINIPYTNGLNMRNSANSSDVVAVNVSTINSVVNIIGIGSQTSAGVVLDARTKAGVPTTSDIPNGQWALFRDSSGATTKLYYNNAGAIQSVALT